MINKVYIAKIIWYSDSSDEYLVSYEYVIAEDFPSAVDHCLRWYREPSNNPECAIADVQITYLGDEGEVMFPKEAYDALLESCYNDELKDAKYI